MNTAFTAKMKKLFEQQMNSLLYSSQIISEEFMVKSDDLADEADLTQVQQEQEMRLRLRNREALLIKKINLTLNKINAGTFGVCECCVEDIEVSRLEVRPTATLCITCKEASEIQESKGFRARPCLSIA